MRSVELCLSAMKFILCILITILVYKDIESIEVATTIPPVVKTALKNFNNKTRRILSGEEVTDEMPFMVYLKLPRNNPKYTSYHSWLCGGAIIHEEYILTSAACIEDTNNFYVVSGTYKYDEDADRYNSPCIKNGAKKAIWKCIPKNYMFDGHENDNIRWMNNDIAVVQVEDGFDFTRRVRGCDFIPKPICYNNQSQNLEQPGTTSTIAGWGTTERFSEVATRRDKNSQRNLLSSVVDIIAKNRCKQRWGPRYHNIIDNYMICSRDAGQAMSEVCNEKYVDCIDISYDGDGEAELRRKGDEQESAKRTERIPTNLVMHSGHHNNTRRLRSTLGSGGFCENDHGGPMISGTGVHSVLIGIISACLVKERSSKCYGPFLYTSVYRNRQFIACAVFKDLDKCRRQFRSEVETYEEKVLSWQEHPDGPAKNELKPGQKPKPTPYASTPIRNGATSKRIKVGYVILPEDTQESTQDKKVVENPYIL